MTNYADYAYYTGTYEGAAIDAASFTSNARKATLEIKKYTFNRTTDTDIPDDARMCCCELAELFYKDDQSNSNGISSEKVGEYSVSYVTPEAKQKMLDLSVNSIINNWLGMTGLLYRGCD